MRSAYNRGKAVDIIATTGKPGVVMSSIAQRIEQITRENDHILNQLNLGKCEQRWVKTTDGKH